MEYGIILVAIAIVGLIYLIRYCVTKAVDKGADAVENAIKRKKNAASDNESENLADRFHSDASR